MSGAYGIHEPVTEFLRVVDPLTKGIIYCVNRINLRQPNWASKFLIGTQVPYVNVCKDHPVNNKLAFTHDSFVSGQKITQTFVDLLVDYACVMHDHLTRTGSVVVHCKNGRSRSPTVILAFFILRGIPRTHAIAFLEQAFQTQRPTIAFRSAAFPNFAKWSSLTLYF